MWSPRAQCDEHHFSDLWRRELENTPRLHMVQDSVVSLIIEEGTIKGTRTALGMEYYCNCLVLTTGTFMGRLMHIGTHQMAGGRMGEPASHGITEQLAKMGFRTDRMKTGTPIENLDGRTINFDLCEEQKGDEEWERLLLRTLPLQ